jgi:MFS family permease
MTIRMLRQYIPLLVIALSIVMSFTPIYSIGVALIIGTIAINFPILSGGPFRLLSTRLAVSFLLFNAWIMLVGCYAWLTHITLPTPIYIVSFIAAYLLTYAFTKPKTLPPVEIESSRLKSSLSAVLALAPIAIIFLSFYFPHPSLSSSVQIITNGYDNTAHLSLIHTTYEHDGYVYGSYEDIKSEIGWETLTAYPQGWHHSTAFLWNGLGQSVFTGTSSALEINLYIITVFTWYFVMSFLFHQALWYILQKTKRVKKLSFVAIATFVGMSILAQLLVFWGSLVFGFATFICALAYLFLLVLLIVYTQELKLSVRATGATFVAFIVALLSVMAIAQGWLFAVPIAAISTFFGFFHILPFIYRNIRTKLSAIVPMIVAGVLILAPVAIQIFINQAYSTQGSSQINDDGGIFGINTLLALVAIVAAIYYVSTGRLRDKKLTTTLLIIVIPAVAFCALLYIYQLYAIGHTAYFFTKALAMTLCLVWIPLSVAVFSLTNTIRRALPSLAAVSVIVVSFLLIPPMLGQDITSFTRLLQRNSNMTTEVADKVAAAAMDDSLGKGGTIVLAGQSYDGDTIGSIFTTMQGALSRDHCMGEAMWTIATRRNDELANYLNKCVKDRKVQVITSPDTSKKILDSLDDSITIK